MRLAAFIAYVIATALPCAALAQAPAPQPAPAAAAATPAKTYTTAETEIGTLLDDPKAKAVLDKHLPGFSANPQIEMARGMTLRAVQQYSPDELSDTTLGAVDADLAKLSPQ